MWSRSHPSHFSLGSEAGQAGLGRGRGPASDCLLVTGSYLCRENRTGTGGTFWCENSGGIKETRSDQQYDHRPRTQVHPPSPKTWPKHQAFPPPVAASWLPLCLLGTALSSGSQFPSTRSHLQNALRFCPAISLMLPGSSVPLKVQVWSTPAETSARPGSTLSTRDRWPGPTQERQQHRTEPGPGAAARGMDHGPQTERRRGLS